MENRNRTVSSDVDLCNKLHGKTQKKKKKNLKKAEKHRSCGVSLKTSTVKCPMAPENGH